MRRLLISVNKFKETMEKSNKELREEKIKLQNELIKYINK